LLDNHKIGNHILTLRKSSNLTQVELSNLVGVSHQAVSKWENGECLPDIEVLLKLAKVFNQSVEKLLLVEPASTKSNVKPDLIWEHVLEKLKEVISKPSFDVWLKPTSAGDSSFALEFRSCAQPTSKATHEPSLMARTGFIFG